MVDWSLLRPNAFQQGYDEVNALADRAAGQLAGNYLAQGDFGSAANVLARRGKISDAVDLQTAGLNLQQKRAKAKALDELTSYVPPAYKDALASNAPASASAPASAAAISMPPAGSGAPMSGSPPGGLAPDGSPMDGVGQPRKGFDFRNTLQTQDDSDPVLHHRLAVLEAAGHLTKEQVAAFEDAYKTTPPAQRKAQQDYSSAAVNLATQLASIQNDVVNPKSGTYDPDGGTAIAKRKAVLSQNLPYLRDLFLKAHPGVDPSAFEQSVANLDLTRNGLMSVANMFNTQLQFQGALDKAGTGDGAAEKAFEENRHNQEMERIGRLNAGSNATRARAAVTSAGAAASNANVNRQIAGKVMDGSAPPSVLGSVLPPGWQTD